MHRWTRQVATLSAPRLQDEHCYCTPLDFQLACPAMQLAGPACSQAKGVCPQPFAGAGICYLWRCRERVAAQASIGHDRFQGSTRVTRMRRRRYCRLVQLVHAEVQGRAGMCGQCQSSGSGVDWRSAPSQRSVRDLMGPSSLTHHFAPSTKRICSTDSDKCQCFVKALFIYASILL